MQVQVMGILFFFIFAASGSCIAGEQFSYCFIQMYRGGDLQMPVLLKSFSILVVLDAFMLSSAYLFSTSLLFQLINFSSLDFQKI